MVPASAPPPHDGGALRIFILFLFALSLMRNRFGYFKISPYLNLLLPFSPPSPDLSPCRRRARFNDPQILVSSHSCFPFPLLLVSSSLPLPPSAPTCPTTSARTSVDAPVLPAWREPERIQAERAMGGWGGAAERNNGRSGPTFGWRRRGRWRPACKTETRSD